MGKFCNPFVRDLAWAISSPCIIKNPALPTPEFFSKEYSQLERKLRELDKQPQPLIDFLAKSKRITLGNYFENLIEFWLAHRANTKILARNIQVQDGKLTIGECDFIVEMGGKITHLEVAIKYYLAIENSSAQRHWVGRGLKDRLDMKFDKLVNQQLELSSSPQMSEHLSALGVHKIDSKMAIFKGYFFQHYFSTNHLLPEDSIDALENSYWCNISEIHKLPESFSQWQVLQKPHWLTHNNEWFAREELEDKANDYFTQVKETPVLLNALDGEQVVKFFISPQHWPAFH